MEALFALVMFLVLFCNTSPVYGECRLDYSGRYGNQISVQTCEWQTYPNHFDTGISSDIKKFQVRYLGHEDNNLTDKHFELASYRHLLFLDLSENRIQSVSPFCFIHLPELRTISLNYNNLTVLPDNIFLPNPQLRELNISYNHLQRVPLLLGLKSLEKVDLSENDILTTGYLVWPNSLKRIDLSGNKLKEIPNFCLSNLTSLLFLNIAKNNLKEFKYGVFDCMTQLQTLNISYNEFETVPTLVYHLLGNLQYFYIDNNRISDIHVVALSNVIKITLQNNRWSCDRLMQIINELKKKNVHLRYAGFRNHSNIHGIECSEDSPTEYQPASNDRVNKDLESTFLYNFFNKDFQKSKFFNYLEGLSNKKSPAVAENFDETFKNSATYRFFNTDFKNSNFFKYLESLKKPQVIVQRIYDSDNNTRVEKLVSSLEEHPQVIKGEYFGLITAILILMIIMIVVYLYVNVKNIIGGTTKIPNPTELLHNEL